MQKLKYVFSSQVLKDDIAKKKDSFSCILQQHIDGVFDSNEVKVLSLSASSFSVCVGDFGNWSNENDRNHEILNYQKHNHSFQYLHRNYHHDHHSSLVYRGQPSSMVFLDKI